MGQNSNDKWLTWEDPSLLALLQDLAQVSPLQLQGSPGAEMEASPFFE